jgi:hypothetical protein
VIEEAPADTSKQDTGMKDNNTYGAIENHLGRTNKVKCIKINEKEMSCDTKDMSIDVDIGFGTWLALLLLLLIARKYRNGAQ